MRVSSRLYEGVSGELVWESDEHEGHEARLLAPPSSYHWIGILDNSGVWVLRSRRLLEHTHLMAHGLFPITTNADEVHTLFDTSVSVKDLRSPLLRPHQVTTWTMAASLLPRCAHCGDWPYHPPDMGWKHCMVLCR